jgi:hypothetical protein
MKTVQVAIEDREYADSVRHLLLQDGRHRVQVLEKPDVTLGGVIIIDVASLDKFSLEPTDQDRLVVIAHKESDKLSKVWDAGLRHVVFYGDPPQRVLAAVLGVELTLWLIQERSSST